MQRLLIQFLAIIVIIGAGGLAYAHINASETVVVLAPSVMPTATPPAGGISSAATPAPTPLSGAIHTPEPGWGQTTIYLGSYRLTASSNPKVADAGRLTIFFRSSTELSGILSLPPASQTDGSFLADLYLTGFTHNGTARSATINLGSA